MQEEPGLVACPNIVEKVLVNLSTEVGTSQFLLPLLARPRG